jgi:glycosyltransferase involved in cell wall biosynthesis
MDCCSEKNMIIAILTPIYFPATGGASEHYSLVSKYGDSFHNIAFDIYTERKYSHNREKFNERVIEIFPERAGKTVSSFKNYFLFALQNILYFKFLVKVCNSNYNIIIVHSSFLNPTSAFPVVLKLLRLILNTRKTKLVLDVRDNQLPKHKYHLLSQFDKVITCSDIFYNKISSLKRINHKIYYAPVAINEQEMNDLSPISNIKADFFLLYVGLIKKEKGARLLLESFVEAYGCNSSVSLVMIGKVRDRKIVQDYSFCKNVFFAGEAGHNEVLSYVKYSKMVVIPSLSEGVPRIALEAISLKKPVLLPSNIPEFDKVCDINIIKSHTTSYLSKKLTEEAPPCSSYDIEKHYYLNSMNVYFNAMFDNMGVE